MVELNNLMGIFKAMEAGVYSVVEHKLDTAKPTLKKNIYNVCTQEDNYARLEWASCKEYVAERSWKP